MAKNNNTKIIDILITNGVDLDCVDSKAQTPLMYASKRGNIRICDYLLSKGVDVNAEDYKKNTALHYSCINNHDECGTRILKKCHLLVNATNDELKTPLHISAGNGLVKLTQELLSAGASVNASDIDGMTPSLCCAKNSDVADCLMLIESIMLNEMELRKSMCDMESASIPTAFESRQSIIKRKSAQIFCDNTPNLSCNNISDHHNSSDSDFY
jgi:ankyrin repeat protein